MRRLLRKMIILMSALSSVLALPAWCLGVGTITVYSALNQPFMADIQLLETAGMKLGDIEVRVADPAHFKRLKLTYHHLLNHFQFRVLMNELHKPVIRVTTHPRVTTPYLQFLLAIKWPGGQLFRAYTVLFDPPELLKVRKPEASLAPAKLSRDEGQVTYGPVRATETLFHIAQRYRPSNSVSLQQTMLALQRLNPKSFLHRNINLLKAGSYLKIPTLDMIQAIDIKQAQQEVAAEMLAWRHPQQRSTLPAPSPQAATFSVSDNTDMTVIDLLSRQTVPQAKSIQLLAQTRSLSEPQKAVEEPVARDEMLKVSVAASQAASRATAAMQDEIAQLKQNNEFLRHEVSQRDKELQDIKERLAHLNDLLEAQQSRPPQPATQVVAADLPSSAMTTWQRVFLAMLLVFATAAMWYWRAPLLSQLSPSPRRRRRATSAKATHKPATVISAIPELAIPEAETTVSEIAEALAMPTVVSHPAPEQNQDATKPASKEQTPPAAPPEAETTAPSPDNLNNEEPSTLVDPHRQGGSEQAHDTLDFEQGLGAGLTVARSGERDEQQYDIQAPAAEMEVGNSLTDSTSTEQSARIDTKLQLAEAYLSMNDQQAAREILQEVMAQGTPAQQARAAQLRDSLTPPTS